MSPNETLLKDIRDLLKKMDRCDCCCFDPCDKHQKLSNAIYARIEEFVAQSNAN